MHVTFTCHMHVVSTEWVAMGNQLHWFQAFDALLQPLKACHAMADNAMADNAMAGTNGMVH